MLGQPVHVLPSSTEIRLCKQLGRSAHGRSKARQFCILRVMRILILAGGPSNEREVSLRSGNAVIQAVNELGYSHVLADPSNDGFDLNDSLRDVDTVFLALHGAGGEDGSMQAQLEQADVPFVGSGSKSSELCFNKWTYKQLLQDNNLPVSMGLKVSLSDQNHEYFFRPFVLKPFEGGSSLDTLIARNPNFSAQAQAKSLLEKYPEMLLEPLVEGTEITVGILGQEPLPVTEIQTPDGLEFDYENKYNGRTREICPPETVSEENQLKAQQLALQIHNLCGCRHMSRTDIIIDAAGNFHVLETNTIPGFTEASLFPLMARQAGYPMPKLVDALIQAAIQDTLVDQRA